MCVCHGLSPVRAADETEEHGRQIAGVLAPQLVADRHSLRRQQLVQARLEDLRRLPQALPEGAKAYVGRVEFQAIRDYNTTLLLVEQAQSRPVLWVDINVNGRYEQAEQFQPDIRGDISFDVPLAESVYSRLPVLVHIAHRNTDNEPGVIWISTAPLVQGTVTVGDRRHVVEYEYSVLTNTADLRFGWQGFDLNGDGQIDRGEDSPERDYPRQRPIVWQLAGLTLQTEEVDVAARKVIFRALPTSAAYRIPLVRGAQVPDFSYVDMSGAAHRRSGLSARFVLLHLWATWCAPCLAEMPELRSLYGELRPSGLEILGLNADADVAVARKAVQELSITWPQATAESVRDLVYERFRIKNWPVFVLLDHEGKIVAAPDELQIDSLRARLHWLLAQKE